MLSGGNLQGFNQVLVGFYFIFYALIKMLYTQVFSAMAVPV